MQDVYHQPYEAPKPQTQKPGSGGISEVARLTEKCGDEDDTGVDKDGDVLESWDKA